MIVISDAGVEENVVIREQINKASIFEEIVGASPALTDALSLVSKVAGSDSTVLRTGETDIELTLHF